MLADRADRLTLVPVQLGVRAHEHGAFGGVQVRVHVLHRLQIVRRGLREGSIMQFGNWEKVVGFIYDFDEALFAHQFGAVLALVLLLASSGLAATFSRTRASSTAVQAVLPCRLLAGSLGGGAGFCFEDLQMALSCAGAVGIRSCGPVQGRVCRAGVLRKRGLHVLC